MPETVLAFTRADPDDSRELAGLWQACGLVRAWNDPEKDIAFACENPGSAILLARHKGRLAASVMAGHDGHRGAVYYVSVHPDFQGLGFGKQVMAAAEDWLRSQGVWKVNLLVRAQNARVRGFYEGLGYQVEERLCMARKLLEEP